MANKNIFVLFGIVFIFLIGNVSAVIINEIMYNPVQNEHYNEWIEIYNEGGSNIDLTGWNLCGKFIQILQLMEAVWLCILMQQVYVMVR
ncbi:MAG: hypothetical protein QT10_C0012G0038 [archaeon GW2011_AR19]|nr:MAG: hypothetical protein QT10_C0012G0038 [archaeon GW2011_AR19]